MAPAKVETPEGQKPMVSDRLAAELENLPELSAAATVVAIREAKEKAAREQPWWLRTSVRDSVRNARENARRLGGWWRQWRTSSSFRVLLAFVAIYTLLAYVRTPSAVVVEHSLRVKEAAFLQDFLRSYCAAGGAVQTMRPHGGSEIFPRAVVLQGELLEAFRRAPVGETFSITVSGAMWNPLQAFYGFPPIYAGGKYFQLEQKFDFSRYRFSLLVRRDSEKAGMIVLAGVERAP